jgi:hypothetical protein
MANRMNIFSGFSEDLQRVSGKPYHENIVL